MKSRTEIIREIVKRLLRASWQDLFFVYYYLRPTVKSEK